MEYNLGKGRVEDGSGAGGGEVVWLLSFPQLDGGDREGNSVGIREHWAVPMASMDRARVETFIVTMICCRGWVGSAFYDMKMMKAHLVSSCKK